MVLWSMNGLICPSQPPLIHTHPHQDVKPANLINFTGHYFTHPTRLLTPLSLFHPHSPHPHQDLKTANLLITISLSPTHALFTPTHLHSPLLPLLSSPHTPTHALFTAHSPGFEARQLVDQFYWSIEDCRPWSRTYISPRQRGPTLQSPGGNEVITPICL